MFEQVTRGVVQLADGEDGRRIAWAHGLSLGWIAKGVIARDLACIIRGLCGAGDLVHGRPAAYTA